MGLVIDTANSYLRYCLAPRDLFLHTNADPTLLSQLRKDWRGFLRNSIFYEQAIKFGVAAILERFPADATEAEADYYERAARVIQDQLGEFIYNTTGFTSLADKLYLKLVEAHCTELGRELHKTVYGWREHTHIRRQGADPIGYEEDVGLLLSYLRDFLNALASTIRVTYKRVKNVVQLEALGLPTDTKQLEVLVKKAIADKELGELFFWKKVEGDKFKTWLDEWFRGEESFVHFVISYLGKLDPDFKVKGPATKKLNTYDYSSRKVNKTTMNIAFEGTWATAAAGPEWGVMPAPQAVAAPAPVEVVINELFDEDDANAA